MSGTGVGIGIPLGSNIGGTMPWSPNDAAIGSPEIWFRPESLPAPGELVTNWDDSSTNDNDASQGTAASKPLVVANVVDAADGAYFGGVDDWLDLGSDITFTGKYEIHAVMMQNSTINFTPFGGDDATDRPFFISAGGRVWAQTDGGAVTVSGDNELVDGTFYLVSVRRDAADDYVFWRNGADRTSGSPNSAGDTAIKQIGKRDTTYGKMNLVELVAWADNTSAPDLTNTFFHFSSRYPALEI